MTPRARRATRTAQAGAGGRARGLPLAFLPLVLTYLAVAMNMTVASVALPTISTAMPATGAQLVWVVNITPLASAGLILFAGSWGDRFGRRRVLMSGVVVFGVAAVLSAQATAINQLIILRGVTGVGSALVMPAALALTFDVVAEPSRRTAVGIIGGTQAVGALLGPLLAGALLVNFSWGAAFWSVTPLLALSLALIAWKVPRDGSRRAGEPIDVGGASLMAVAGTALLYAAVTGGGRTEAGGSWALGALAVGLAGVAGLVWWESRVPNPIFSGSIVRDRRFWLPTLTIAATQLLLGAVMFANTQYVQLVLGYSALAAGLVLLPALVVWMASSATVGLSTARLGDKAVLVGGLLLAALGLVLMSRGGVSPSMPLLLAGLLLMGCMGVAPALMTHMAVSVYPPARRTVGSAINSVAVRFGLALGIAAGGSVILAVFSSRLRPALAGLPPAEAAAADNSIGAALRVARGLPDPSGALLAQAGKVAFADGLRVALLAGAALLVILALLNLALMPRTVNTEPDQMEVAT